MSRLPPPDRDALPPEDQAVWDRIASVRSGVRGPFGVLMHVPQLADRVRALEDSFRLEGELSGADRELVILVTAREMGARYAWGPISTLPGHSSAVVGGGTSINPPLSRKVTLLPLAIVDTAGKVNARR